MSKKKKNKKVDPIKRSRAIDREIHFEDKKSAREWIGTGGVHKDKKDKRKTRSSRRKGAIRESVENE